MIRFLLLALCSAPFFAPVAEAAPKKRAKAAKKKVEPEPPPPLQFELPSRAPEATIAVVHPHEESVSLFQVNLAVTTWIPNDPLTLPARVTNASDFSKSKWPGIEVGVRTSSLGRALGLTYNGSLSLGLQHLTRSAGFSPRDYVYEETQSLFLLPSAVGLETTLARWEKRSFVPRVGLALLPTIGILSSSSISSGGNYFSWAWESRLSFSGLLSRDSDSRWLAFVALTRNLGSRGKGELKFSGYSAGVGLLF